ncbi:phage portal protein [Thalassococcus sp. S3]|uniref:phage portal protein n=1 Tax=Thalassococcus sp. S3 TaxID=2017482 RepID=UPI0010247901|nr:phage portal protein [Thalassococcus sp. S3]QBF32153.1 phage portal protein [Thalassococcus sp. S3]
MIRLLRAAARGARAEYAGTGWRSYFGNMNWALGGTRSHAGKTVNARTSLEVSAVWACVRKTAEMISTLPVDHYRKGSGDSRERLDDDLAEIIKESPNPEQTAPEYWEGMVAQTCLQGNACSEKLYMGSRLVGLRPLLDCRPERRQDGTMRYAVTDRGKTEFMPAEKVFHLRGFGAGDGLGMSTVRYGANSIGAALAADETAGKIFSNAAMPSGVLSADQTLNSEQRSQLQALLEAYSQSSKAGKTMVLEAGLKYQQLQMNPEDAQLLETRRFGVEDICRWFGVPPIVIGHAAEGQTMWGTGVEAILLAWRTLGINPFLIRLEMRIKKDLIPPQNRRRHYVEYNREAMIQMDSKAKGDLLQKLGMSGTMTANERRARMNLPRHDDPNADALLAQTALSPLELLGKDST